MSDRFSSGGVATWACSLPAVIQSIRKSGRKSATLGLSRAEHALFGLTVALYSRIEAELPSPKLT